MLLHVTAGLTGIYRLWERNDMGVLRYVHSAVVLVLLLGIGIVYLIPLCIVFCIPLRLRYGSRIVQTLLYSLNCLVLRALLIPITYTRSGAAYKKPAIYIANHQSAIDIPLMGSLLGCKPHVWLARTDLSTSSIPRWFVSQFAVMVNQQSTSASMRSVLAVIRMLIAKPVSMIIFPEGARYSDGQVHAFSHGFVILAKKTGRPIIPVRIVNAATVYAANAYLLTWAPIQVYVGEPMVQDVTEMDDEFAHRVHNWFTQQEVKEV